MIWMEKSEKNYVEIVYMSDMMSAMIAYFTLLFNRKSIFLYVFNKNFSSRYDRLGDIFFSSPTLGFIPIHLGGMQCLDLLWITCWAPFDTCGACVGHSHGVLVS